MSYNICSVISISIFIQSILIIVLFNIIFLGFVSHTSVCKDHQSIIGGLTSLSTLLMAALLAISTLFVSIILYLAKVKAKIQTELNTLKENRKNTTTYEDINLFPASTQTIRVNDNVAYANVVVPVQ